MSRRLVVGLTGSFGSGKSTVGRILKDLGARKVIDADRLAHEVFHTNHPIAKKIKTLFNIKGALSRKVVAQEVFSKPEKRKQLEALIHPYVYRRIVSELKKVKSGIMVLEVPLLFETGFNKICDITVAILAGNRNIVKRLVRSGFSSKEVRVRLQIQLPEREKRKRANLYIKNSGSKKLLIQKTKLVWQKLQSILNKN